MDTCLRRYDKKEKGMTGIS